MKRKLSGILTLLLVLVVQISFAQDRTIAGMVTDSEGLPLPGVNVLVKNTNRGTQTDFDGNYSIRASENEILVFSYLGFETIEYPIANLNTINVTLSPDAAELDEVIVQGYRTSTKEKSNIASITVSSESIENRPNASVVQTLSGQVAGLNISTNSGQPGAASVINLRGVNSINGNTQPLFLIDGIPVDESNFRSLNPQDIASISVLKDAGATAIYGNRGANGVVIIETKQGNFDSPLQISATSIISWNKLQDHDYDLNNAPEELGLENLYGSGRGASMSEEEIASAESADWLNHFFRTGITKNNTLSLSSGGERATQFTSLGFYDTQGILKGSDLKRFNFRNNITGKSDNDKFNYGSSVSINYSNSNEPSSIGTGGVNQNFVLGAFQALPYVLPSGYEEWAEAPVASFTATPYMLMDKLKYFKQADEEVKILGSFNANYNFTDYLSASIVMSADYENEIYVQAVPSESFNIALFAETGNDNDGRQTQSSRRVFSYNQVASLNFNESWDKHTLDVGVFTEYFKAHLRSFGYTANGLFSKTFALGDGAGFISDNSQNDWYTDEAFATSRNAGLFSYFGQINYDYDTTYGVGATVRRDASYRFPDANKWGTFYSVSARWNINNEDFMDGSVFDILKLRASHGTAGNQRITGDTYFSGPDLGKSLFASGVGYGGENAIFLSQIGNPSLKWETVTQTNVGVDFEVFNRRLRGSFDAYWKKTEDLFQSMPVSAINATTGINTNIGSLTNQGYDVNLKYDVLRGGPGGFNMDVSFVGNYNKQEFVDLPSETGVIEDIGREGGKFGEIYTIRFAGVNPANGNVLFYTADGDVTETPNTDTDRVWTDKNIYPDYTGSFGINMDYKGFFIQSQFNYAVGGDRFDWDLLGYQDPSSIGTFRHNRDLARAWTPENRVTDIPSLTATNINTYDSDRYLRSTDHLRIRFLGVGYNVPNRFLEPTGFNQLRIFANAENLVTFSEWRGFDVEALQSAQWDYPTPRIISLGVELAF
ncbi:SusC/RagA family TonB-linked outer membrane protein [Salinimicrobium sp. WS361]|uniref:SusC/RagA family TonB-linked outer membrane protein n=1 Tax=Salinimicrobium sp. WS361 TaxID=3425123 RepID=UPI003D6EE0FD